jgi:peptidyl-dipeptidase Dcp
MTNTNTFSQIYAADPSTNSLRDSALPFDKLNVDAYLPALKSAIEEARQNLNKIKNHNGPATFENTILALETSGELVELISGVYFNLFSAEANEQHQELAKDISPILAAYQSDVSLDEKLFSKIQEVFEKKSSLQLNQEQTRLLEKFHKDFVRNGALLPADKKEKLRTIDQELSLLGPKFSENVLKATNSYELWIDKKEDLAGLPEGVIEAAHMEAQAKNRPESWLFTLNVPSYFPFLQYADNRELRKKVWMAASSKSFGGEFDNQPVILKIVKLRHERAQLLGYPTHAHFVLEERMAKEPNQVTKFLGDLLVPSKTAAQKDVAEMKAFKNKLSGSDELMPWDFAYYSEKLKEEKFSFSEEELRPYFKLENVIDGVFAHAQKLYGIVFKPITDVPVYHADVKTYEVIDESSGNYIGLFYADFFPRPTKKGGAWMTSFREQGHYFGKVRRPHVSIVCNFTKPTPTKPSLLSFDEVQTLFHEFGHALHGLLSECTYRSLAGTSVFWDFVELPSQIMENWTLEKEALDLFARHYQTQQPMPAELIKKVKDAAHFQSGWASMRQLNFALMDMSWHTTDPSQITDVDKFETKATEQTRLLPKIDGTNSSCAFSHIFAGGYSAGYYSYKWAEVLDADAFEYFKEKGLFNREVAKKFRDNILSRGGTEHPMDLYKKFRGREPDPKALLRREGLLAEGTH